MEKDIKRAVEIFMDYAEAVKAQYSRLYDITASIDYGEVITFRICAFTPTTLSIVAIEHIYIREREDAAKVVELQEKFNAQMRQLVDKSRENLLANKARLEAELAAINAKLDL